MSPNVFNVSIIAGNAKTTLVSIVSNPSKLTIKISNILERLTPIPIPTKNDIILIKRVSNKNIRWIYEYFVPSIKYIPISLLLLFNKKLFE